MLLSVQNKRHGIIRIGELSAMRVVRPLNPASTYPFKLSNCYAIANIAEIMEFFYDRQDRRNDSRTKVHIIACIRSGFENFFKESLGAGIIFKPAVNFQCLHFLYQSVAMNPEHPGRFRLIILADSQSTQNILTLE